MKTPHKAYYYIFNTHEHIIEVIFKDTEDNDNKITEDGEDKITEDSP